MWFSALTSLHPFTLLINTCISKPYIHTTVQCPDLPDPKNGQVSLSGMTVGRFAIYQCDAGFIPTGGNVVRVCEPNGQWSGSAPTCEGISILVSSNPSFLYHVLTPH